MSLFLRRFASVVKTHNIVRLSHHGVIDIPVQAGLLHRGEVVELQQPGLQSFIKKKVNTKQFVATVVTGGLFPENWNCKKVRNVNYWHWTLYFIIPWSISGWPHIRVLTQVFLILLHTLCQSTPLWSRYFQNDLSDHLCPTHSSGASLYSKFSLFLLTLKNKSMPINYIK